MFLSEYKYPYIPPNYYEDSIKNNLLQKFWHKQRYKALKRNAVKVQKNILDIGSADGYFTHIIKDISGCEKIIGIDVLEDSVNYANQRYAGTNMNFMVLDCHNLSFPDNSFEAIFALESLEHMEDPKTALNEIKRVLMPNGTFLAIVPTDNLLFRIIWGVWTKLKGKIWKDAHLQSFSKRSLQTLMVETGFLIETEYKFLMGMLILVKAKNK